MSIKYYIHVVKADNKNEAKKVNDIWSEQSGQPKHNIESLTYFPVFLHLIDKDVLKYYGSCMIESPVPIHDLETYTTDKRVMSYREFVNKYTKPSKYVRQLKFESLNEDMKKSELDAVYDKIVPILVKKYPVIGEDTYFWRFSEDNKNVVRFNYIGRFVKRPNPLLYFTSFNINKYTSPNVTNDKFINGIDREFYNFGKKHNITWVVEDDQLPNGGGRMVVGYYTPVNSKYVRQLKFEAVEPGKEPGIKEIKEKIIVKLTTAKDSKALQLFLFKNGIFWCDGQKTYHRINDGKFPSYVLIHGGDLSITTNNDRIKFSISFSTFKEKYMDI